MTPKPLTWQQHLILNLFWLAVFLVYIVVREQQGESVDLLAIFLAVLFGASLLYPADQQHTVKSIELYHHNIALRDEHERLTRWHKQACDSNRDLEIKLMALRGLYSHLRLAAMKALENQRLARLRITVEMDARSTLDDSLPTKLDKSIQELTVYSTHPMPWEEPNGQSDSGL